MWEARTEAERKTAEMKQGERLPLTLAMDYNHGFRDLNPHLINKV